LSKAIVGGAANGRLGDELASADDIDANPILIAPCEQAHIHLRDIVVTLVFRHLSAPLSNKRC
jgi:hypothetical protein